MTERSGFTVKEAIAILKDMPPDDKLVMVDPDTGWILRVEYIGQDPCSVVESSEQIPNFTGGRNVFITAKYDNMINYEGEQ